MGRLNSMATWKDGPRYAPQTRPYAFAEPAAALSLAPPPPSPVLPPAPDTFPAFHPSAPAAPLEALAAKPAPVRNPQTPFATQSLMMTATNPTEAIVTSAQPQARTPTAAATLRSPQQPFTVASSAASTTPRWAPPSEFDHPVGVVHPVAVRDALNAAYPPLLIGMAVMGFVGITQTQPILTMLALASVPFIFAQRTRFRVRQLRIASILALGLLAILWLIQAVLNATTLNTDIGMGWWCLFACWGLALFDIYLQWIAIRNGEQPSA